MIPTYIHEQFQSVEEGFFKECFDPMVIKWFHNCDNDKKIDLWHQNYDGIVRYSEPKDKYYWCHISNKYVASKLLPRSVIITKKKNIDLPEDGKELVYLMTGYSHYSKYLNEDECFVKIGITQQTLSRRAQDIKDQFKLMRVVNPFHYIVRSNKKRAYNLEQALLNYYSDYNVRYHQNNTKIEFGQFSEWHIFNHLQLETCVRKMNAFDES